MRTAIRQQSSLHGEGQGIPVCGSPWGRKESDTTEQLNKKMGQH